MHGYYDPAGLDDVVARVRAERADLEYDIVVNDRRAFTDACAPDPERIAAAAALTTTWWNRKVDTLDAMLNISVDAAPDAVNVTICADTLRLGTADIEALAREMEAVTVTAALEDSPAHPVETEAASPTQG
ncbi:hypothetical protein [Dactylosporangium sp. NPDC051484]|uniref:hypothetical protein n=1 Tax=Dactylosporangium sp. NPDC051484 TaxID=3154942 RepID=UPI00344DE48D